MVEVNNAMEELEFQKDVEAMKLKSEIDRLIDSIDTNKKLLDVYSSRVDDAKQLADKKLIAKDQYNNMLEKKLSLQNNLKASESQLSQAKLRRDESIAQKKQLHDRALDRLDVQKYVRAPYDGSVIAIGTRIGESLSNGSPVIQIVKGGLSSSLKHVAYFPVDKGKKIYKGMSALVTPSSVEREEFSSIKGIVSEVSLYPISKERIRSIVGDEATVEQMSRGPVIEVQIQLNEDSETASGYEWTSGSGPTISITPGLSATSYVITEVKKPISYAIPWIKNQLVGKPVDEIKKPKN
jgi:HlyD family secretion protein